jgi:hypothetical protein
MTDADGDRVFAAWKCQGAPRCQGEFRWTGGTGKYVGISGGSSFHAVSLVPTLSGYSVWKGEWQLP